MKSFWCTHCGFVLNAIIPPDVCPSCEKIMVPPWEHDDNFISMKHIKRKTIHNYLRCETCSVIYPLGARMTEYAPCPDCSTSDYHNNREPLVSGVKSYLKDAVDYAKSKNPQVEVFREKTAEVSLLFKGLNTDDPQDRQVPKALTGNFFDAARDSAVAGRVERLTFICPFCGVKQKGFNSPDRCSSCKNWVLPPSLRGKVYPSMTLVAKSTIEDQWYCEKCGIYQKNVGVCDPGCPICSARGHHNKREPLIFMVKSFWEDTDGYMNNGNPSAEIIGKKLNATYEWFRKFDYLDLDDEEWDEDELDEWLNE